jgi:hypothetical protein
MSRDKQILYALCVVVALVALYGLYQRYDQKEGFCPDFRCSLRSPMHLTACNSCDSWDPAALAELKGLDNLSVYGSGAQANKMLNMAIQKAQTATHY